MLKRILIKLVPQRIYKPIRKKIFNWHLSNRINKVRKRQGVCIVFISTPLHGNLGDHAIVYAQELFFADQGLGKSIVEIPSPHYERFSTDIKKKIRDKDLIVIDGGGNMGTLWLEVEHKMRHIVQKFPNNPIIIFPQTVYYSNDALGKLEMQKSMEIYASHNNLHICAREKASYDIMKKIYPQVDILLVPDIVLYLDKMQFNNPRDGALLCLRKDKEKQLTEEMITRMLNKLKSRSLKTRDESTVIPQAVSRKNRIKKLNEKWNIFSGAQLVITDRLHGMIFAAITGTPCVAFDNSSGKVGNVYNWISDLPYIHFINDNDDLDQIIDKLLSFGDSEYDNSSLKPYYEDLFNVIKRAMYL